MASKRGYPMIIIPNNREVMNIMITNHNGVILVNQSRTLILEESKSNLKNKSQIANENEITSNTLA
jgi:hypothetical protein